MKPADKFAPRPVSIYAGDNPWGYQLNVNAPTIKRLYVEYQREHGLSTCTPMTDAQRLSFESEVLAKIRKREIEI